MSFAVNKNFKAMTGAQLAAELEQATVAVVSTKEAIKDFYPEGWLAYECDRNDNRLARKWLDSVNDELSIRADQKSFDAAQAAKNAEANAKAVAAVKAELGAGASDRDIAQAMVVKAGNGIADMLKAGKIYPFDI